MRGLFIKHVLARHARALSYRLRRLPPEVAYWEERAARLGARADSLVSDFEADAEQYRQTLQDALYGVDWPASHEWTAVDYGSGTGRYTALLADAIAGRAVGVDPSPSMLALARPTAATSFGLIRNGRAPVADNSADLVACIHCLGGLESVALADAVADVRRILCRGGVLFVVEADEGESSSHWHGRPVSFYRRLWRDCPLLGLRRVEQSGRQVNLLWGMRG